MSRLRSIHTMQTYTMSPSGCCFPQFKCPYPSGAEAFLSPQEFSASMVRINSAIYPTTLILLVRLLLLFVTITGVVLIIVFQVWNAGETPVILFIGLAMLPFGVMTSFIAHHCTSHRMRRKFAQAVNDENAQYYSAAVSAASNERAGKGPVQLRLDDRITGLVIDRGTVTAVRSMDLCIDCGVPFIGIIALGGQQHPQQIIHHHYHIGAHPHTDQPGVPMLPPPQYGEQQQAGVQVMNGYGGYQGYQSSYGSHSQTSVVAVAVAAPWPSTEKSALIGNSRPSDV